MPPAEAENALDEKEIAILFEKLDAYMAKKGLRSTNQRRMIANAFFAAPNHVTIEDLLARVRETDRRIGYATVYRTLKLFTECGIAAERNFGDGASRYELSDESTHHHHDHLICLACNKIIEFHNETIETLQEAVAAERDFRIMSHRHELYVQPNGSNGKCLHCERAMAG